MSNSVAQQRMLPEDIPVSTAMIEAGLEVLEETDERPLSRLTVERAFQAMFLCALTEFPLGSSPWK